MRTLQAVIGLTLIKHSDYVTSPKPRSYATYLSVVFLHNTISQTSTTFVSLPDTIKCSRNSLRNSAFKSSTKAALAVPHDNVSNTETKYFTHKTSHTAREVLSPSSNKNAKTIYLKQIFTKQYDVGGTPAVHLLTPEYSCFTPKSSYDYHRSTARPSREDRCSETLGD